MTDNRLPAQIASLVKTAPLPPNYEEAKRTIAECERIDQCADWADKMAALASYARQADDRDLENYARRIRLRAVRRCGDLLLTYDGRGGDRTKTVTALDFAQPSRAAVAQEAGLTEHKTRVAVKIVTIPEEDFEAAVESNQPPGTTLLAKLAERHPRERVRSVTQELLAAIVKSEAAGQAIEGLLRFEKCATECGIEAIVEILRGRGHFDHLERAKRGVALAFRLNHALDEAGGRGHPMLCPVPGPEPAS